MTKFLTASAQIYYDYLAKNGLGVEKIRIKSFHIQGQQLLIFLAHKLLSTDTLLLRYEGKDIYIGDEDEIIMISYDDQKHLLILESSLFLNDFKSFELLSDLKFLVKNVELFFTKNSISLPFQKPCSLNDSEIPKERLSEEQIRAMKNIFASPLSYTWGAPGSGKTQRVLFESLLFLIKKDKRVALIAPTNNALELALKTVIKKADEFGLDRSLFLRLGVPSAEFLAFYPESCDLNALDKKQLSLFTSLNPKERLEQTRVVAMTLDGFIKKYESLKLTFDHIFLDECGFAPLIKVCALCANTSPLSMLGDHKQLMPVCEMPDRELAQHPQVKLWNLSGLFLEAFLKEGENVFSYHQLKLQYTKTTILRHTYRYGDNLARILDDFIYHNGLRGHQKESEIYAIDCAKFGGKNLRGEFDSHHTQAQEVEATLSYLRTFGNDFAIITPFVKQRQLLIQNGIPYERVFTIHGSQGQEFDTIVFLPVALHYHLTDSRNPLALQALNVAISRVKKRLIFVCDLKYWYSTPQQFLSVLLRNAKEWKI